MQVIYSGYKLARAIKKDTPMNENLKNHILRLIRHGLTILAGFIIAQDYEWLGDFDFEPIIGVIITFIALQMSNNNTKKLQTKE